jgi:hypothetical protein
MLIARQSFSYVDPFDGERKAVHRGVTRVAPDHELARRFPHRFEAVNMREEARWRFRGQLDQAKTYEEYARTLDRATSRLEAIERSGVFRCSGQSLTDVYG